MSNDYLDQFNRPPEGLARFKSENAASLPKQELEAAVRERLEAIERVQVQLQLHHQRTLAEGFLMGLRAAGLAVEAQRVETELNTALTRKQSAVV